MPWIDQKPAEPDILFFWDWELAKDNQNCNSAKLSLHMPSPSFEPAPYSETNNLEPNCRSPHNMTSSCIEPDLLQTKHQNSAQEHSAVTSNKVRISQICTGR